MLAAESTRYYDWKEFWEELERAEVVWAKKLDTHGRIEFEAAVSSMIRASVHPSHRVDLRRAWDKCRLVHTSPWDDGDFRWNLRCQLDNPYVTTEGAVREIMLAFNDHGAGSNSGPTLAPDRAGVETRVRAFVDELRHVALATMWHFVRSCSTYLDALPAYVRDRLFDDELYDLVLQELLRD